MVEHSGEWRRGWRTVVSSCTGMTILGASLIATGIVMAPIMKEFGWSRAVISASVTITAAMQLLLAPVAGAVISRFGVRRYALASAIAAAISLAAIAWVSHGVWGWYAAWALFGTVSVGISALVWSTAWMTLFDRARGLAGAVVLSGSGLAYLIFPPIAVLVSGHYGWRAVYALLAASSLLILLPLLFIWFKRVDEIAEPSAMTHRQSAERDSKQPGFSLSQALRMRQFWQLALLCVLVALVEGALIVHLFPILNESGLDKLTAAGIASLMGLAMIVGRLLSGLLFDRFSVLVVFAGEIMLMLLACLLARSNAGNEIAGMAISILLGLGAGGATNAVAYITSRYFGLSAYASISGLLMGLFGLGFGIAPVIAGHLRDVLHSYVPIFGPSAGVLGGAALLVLLLGKVPSLATTSRDAP